MLSSAAAIDIDTKSNTENCIKWFKENDMTSNPSKCQAITIGNKDRNIDVTLLGVEWDENLKFDSHLGKICKKAAKQLNSIKRNAKHIADKEKKDNY